MNADWTDCLDSGPLKRLRVRRCLRSQSAEVPSVSEGVASKAAGGSLQHVSFQGGSLATLGCWQEASESLLLNSFTPPPLDPCTAGLSIRLPVSAGDHIYG